MIQYDVSDPIGAESRPGAVRIGGIVAGRAIPAAGKARFKGGPQMVEISRDGKRVYFTNSLYGAIDPQFYHDGPGRLDGQARRPGRAAASSFDEKFFVDWPLPHRPHQIRLEGGDCSSDSYCYP